MATRRASYSRLSDQVAIYASVSRPVRWYFFR